MVLLVRPATLQDADALAVLAEQSFRRAYEDIVDPAIVEAVVAHSCTPSAFRELVLACEQEGRLSTVLVAVEGAVLLGYLDLAEEDDGLELRRLYTRVGETGRGIGSVLLADLEARLPPGTSYRIVVLAQNVRALDFWQRHGFRLRCEVDGLDHFRRHRGIALAATGPAPPLLVLDRTVDTPLDAGPLRRGGASRS